MFTDSDSEVLVQRAEYGGVHLALPGSEGRVRVRSASEELAAQLRRSAGAGQHSHHRRIRPERPARKCSRTSDVDRRKMSG
jgi:hypothetical protein